jgi:membrane protein DedA with SNARE-associated domain
MLLSWMIQWQFPLHQAPNKYEETVIVKYNSIELELTYLQLGNRAHSESLILFPDPYRGIDFIFPLAKELSKEVSVIIPKYPKRDTDGNRLSYSVESRAGFISALADTLQLESIHLTGHGYGGLIATHIASKENGPDVESLVLLAALGIQETHFLGNYTINRSLYSLLYPVVYVYEYAFPHFGRFYNQPLDVEFIRTMMQLDQRNMSETLREVRVPSLILHPQNEGFVPLTTSNEAYRLIPQSTLITEPGHGRTVKKQPELWSKHIRDFIKLVTISEVLTRAGTDHERIRESEKPFDADNVARVTGWAIFIIISLLILTTLISEDLACIAGGLLVASGIIGFHYALLGCFIGILTADVLIYWMGRWIGTPILKWIPFRWFISENDIQRAKEMFEFRGAEIIFVTRFLPGTRMPTYLAAGMLKTSFVSFFAYFFIAIAIWTPMLVGISALIGQPMLAYMELYQEYALWIVLIFIVIIYLFIKFGIPLATVKGRREFYVKWVRLKEKWMHHS